MRRENLGNNMERVLQVRLTSEQGEYLDEISEVLGVSVSDFVRMMINSNRIAYEKSKAGKGDENF